jgi:hypothetical protein
LIFYSVFFLITGIYVLISRSLWNKNSIKSLTFPIILTILISGLRGNVGTDTYAYKHFFNTLWDKNQLLNENIIFSFEPGFVLFSNIIKFVFDNDQFFIFSISAFTGFLFYNLLKQIKEKDLFLLTYIAMFFIMFNLNLLRFGIAMMLLGMSFLNPGGKKKILYFCLALSFHFSVIFSILFFVKKENIYKYLIFLITLLIIGFNFIQNKLGAYFLNFIFVSQLKLELTLFLELIIFYFIIKWNKIDLSKDNIIFCIVIYFILRWFGSLNDLIYRTSYVFGFVIYLSFFKNKLTYKSRMLFNFLFIFYVYRSLAFIYNSDDAMSNLLFDSSGMSSLYSHTKWLPYKFFWESN